MRREDGSDVFGMPDGRMRIYEVFCLMDNSMAIGDRSQIMFDRAVNLSGDIVLG